MNTENDKIGSSATGEKTAVEIEHDKTGSYEDEHGEVTRPTGKTTNKTHADPFTLG